MTAKDKEGCPQEQDCLSYRFPVIITNSPQTGYPVVALSFQCVRNVHVGIIHVNQQDRNSSGEI